MPNDISQGITPDQFKTMGGSPTPPVSATPTTGEGMSVDQFNSSGGKANAPLNDPTQPPSTGNVFNSFMGTILNDTGLPKMAATARALVLNTKDIAHQLINTPGLSPDEQTEMTNNLFKGGPNGETVAPIANPWEAMGVGLKASSYINPIGPEEGVALKTGNWFFNLIKDTAPFAITQALGQGVEDLGDKKSVPQALTDTALNYVTSIAGFGILKGMGGALKATAGALMKSDIAKVANQSLMDFMSKSLSLDGRFAQGTAVTSKDASAQTLALTKQYTAVHKEAMDAFAKSVQTPTNWGDVYKGVVGKVGQVFDGLFKAKDAKYAEVFTKDMFPNAAPTEGAYKQIFDAIDETKKVLGINESSDIANLSNSEKLSIAQRNGEMLNSPAGRYLSTLEDAVGTRAQPKPMSMFDLNHLYTSAPTDPNVVGDKAVQNLATSLYRGAADELKASADPRAKMVMQAWDDAHTQWSNLREMMATKLQTTFKGIADVNSATENIMHSKPDVPTLNALSNFPDDVKQQISDMVYNKSLQLSRQAPYAANYSAGGKAMEKMLDAWSGSGLIAPEHEAVLRSYADAMQGTYEDAANYLKGLNDSATMGAGETTGGVKSQNLAEQALSRAQAAKESVATATGIEKAMGGKPLVRANADGTYDFSNLSDVVDKVNKDGRYDGLVKQLQFAENLKNGDSKKLIGVTKGVLGASLFHAHPFVALGILRSAATDVFGKSAEKITTDDLSQFISQQVSSGKFGSEQYNTFLLNMLQGKFKVAGDILGKVMVGATNNVEGKVTDMMFPQPDKMPDWFSSEFENQTGEPASPDHWSQYTNSLK